MPVHYSLGNNARFCPPKKENVTHTRGLLFSLKKEGNLEDVMQSKIRQTEVILHDHLREI